MAQFLHRAVQAEWHSRAPPLAWRPVSPASAETSVVRVVISLAALAVSVTLRAISAVAAPCCSTAAAIEPAIALTSVIVASIRATAATEAPVAVRT